MQYENGAQRAQSPLSFASQAVQERRMRVNALVGVQTTIRDSRFHVGLRGDKQFGREP